MTSDDTTKEEPKRAAKKSRNTKVNINITVLEGEKIDFGKIFVLTKKKISIGRSEDNDIVLHDPKISKKHCEIDISYGQELGVDEVTITDLFSSNGTYLNGRLVERGILKFGDKIDLGSTILLFSSSDEVEEKYQTTLFDIATIDSLTGLYNRRFILNDLDNQIKLAQRYSRIFSLILFDIDDFKVINDSFGHAAGDEYLKKVTAEIYKCLREQDKAGRVGGEEFLVVLPETDLTGAEVLANRIRQNIEKAVLDYQGSQIKCTVSAGVVQYEEGSVNVEAYFEIVDHAMYQAKKQGKNRVILTAMPAISK